MTPGYFSKMSLKAYMKEIG